VRQKLAVGAVTAALFTFAGVPAASAASSGAAAVQVVDYHGYEIQVPASWPVYDLATDPTRCVLFNQHAVYLGTPGADQQCPDEAFGRTEAVLIEPAQTSVPPGTVRLGSDTASFAGALSTDDTTSHVVQVAAPGPGVQVTATYGSDEAQIQSILAGARMTAKDSAAPTAPTAPTATTAPEPSPRSTTPTTSTSATPTTTSPASAAEQASSPGTASSAGGILPELSVRQGQGNGIDTCTAPSVATMTDWLASPYRVIGTYLGGANWACTYGNFDRAWAAQVAAEGWQYIPIWVGPQAPCTTLTDTTVIDPSNAEAQGETEAASAVAAAESFGYGQGTPVYFDMESYDNSNTSCSQAVTTFLAGWTAGLHAAGYLSGVYSSAATGIADLAALYSDAGYQRPDDVWMADWNDDPVLTDPYLPGGDWPNAVMHQYYGSHNETWGGATLNVDSDVVDAAVAGYPGLPSGVGQPELLDEPSAVAVAPGSTGAARVLLQGGDQASIVNWRADASDGVSVTPGSGSVLVPAHGKATVPVRVSASAAQAGERYDVPIAASADGREIAETYLIVSTGTSVPGSVVLYAADPQSMAIAAAEANRLALPAGSVTGDFEAAWNADSSSSDVVIAVGQAASSALFYNACGWTNPAGAGAGSTPFGFPGTPLSSGQAGSFEAAFGASTAATALLTAQFAHYALVGTLPNEASALVGSAVPADTCLGSANVPVPVQ
jgi:Domain of unknown function (DUF1906)